TNNAIAHNKQGETMNSRQWGTLLLSAALVLSACGSDDDTTEPADSVAEDAGTDTDIGSDTSEATPTTAATSDETEATTGTAAPSTDATEPPTETTPADTTTPTAPAESLDELIAEAEGENTLVVYGN